MEYIISLIISIIIIFLRIKTNIFAWVTKFAINIVQNKKAMLIITRFLLIITPIIYFIILFRISDLLVIKIIPDTTMTVNNAEGESFGFGIVEFLKNCIILSPLFWLVIFFLFEAAHEEKHEPNSIEQNNNSLKVLLVNMQIPLLTNYIIIIFTIFECIIIKLKIKTFEYFTKYFSENIELYSEDTVRIIFIILLGLMYYIFICFMSYNFMRSAFECYNEIFIGKINKNKILACKILLFIPIINIFIVCLIRNKLLKNIRTQLERSV
jgi:hypothetical protein